MELKRPGRLFSFTCLALGLIVSSAGCERSDSGDFGAYEERGSDRGDEASGFDGRSSQSDEDRGGPSKSGKGNRNGGDETLANQDSEEPSGVVPTAGGSPPETDEGNGASAREESRPVEAPAIPPGIAGPPVEQPSDLDGAPPADPKRDGEEKPSEPREIKLLVKDKDFRVEGPEGAIRVTYDDINLLKVLNMEPVPPDAPQHFPGWLNALDGKRIRIRGFMSPPFQQTGLTEFLMGRDNQACCFPGRAKIYDLFPVKMRDGKTVDFIDNRPFDVVGIFQIKPWVEDGELLRLYQIVDAIVIE